MSKDEDFKRASLRGRGRKLFGGRRGNQQPDETSMADDLRASDDELNELFALGDDLGLASEPPLAVTPEAQGSAQLADEDSEAFTDDLPPIDLSDFEFDLLPTDEAEAVAELDEAQFVPANFEERDEVVEATPTFEIDAAPDTSSFEVLDVASDIGVDAMPETDVPLEAFVETPASEPDDSNLMTRASDVDLPDDDFMLETAIPTADDTSSLLTPAADVMEAAEPDTADADQELNLETEAQPLPEPINGSQEAVLLEGLIKPTAGVSIIPTDVETPPPTPVVNTPVPDDALQTEGILLGQNIVDDDDNISLVSLNARAPLDLEGVPVASTRPTPPLPVDDHDLVDHAEDGDAALESRVPFDDLDDLPPIENEFPEFEATATVIEEAPEPLADLPADFEVPAPPNVEEVPAPVPTSPDEGIPLVDDIDDPQIVDVNAAARPTSADIDAIIPRQPETSADRTTYATDRDANGTGGIIAQPAELLATAVEQAAGPLPTPFGERIRPQAAVLFQPTEAADPALVEHLIDDGRLYELWTMIEILQEEIAERPNLKAERADIYQQELLHASNLLLQARENYDDARAVVFRIRADLRRDDQIEADIARYNPALMLYIVGWFVGLVVLGLLSPLLEDAIADLDADFFVHAYMPALFGAAGGLFLAYTTLNRHVTVQRDFDSAHVWWYFSSPFIGALMGFMTYTLWVAMVVTTTAPDLDSISDLIRFPAVVWVLAFVGGLQQNWVINRLRAMRNANTDETNTRSSDPQQTR